MKGFILAVSTLIFLVPSLSAHAELIDQYSRACGTAFSKMVNKQSNTFQTIRSTTVTSQSDLLSLSSMEKHAYQTFRNNNLQNYFTTKTSPYFSVNLSQYTSKATSKISGFRVEIITAKPYTYRTRMYYVLKGQNTHLAYVLLDKPAGKKFWVCDGFQRAPSNADVFIKRVADDIGEYFHYESSPFAKNIKIVSPNTLNAEIKKTVKSYIANNQGSHYNNKIYLSDTQYAIVVDGRIIGFVVSLDYYIDHSQFDGGGVHLYFNLSGKILEEIEWWG